MKTRKLPLLCLTLLAACADRATGPTAAARRQLPAVSFSEHVRVGTYVAMGTSLSMG